MEKLPTASFVIPDGLLKMPPITVPTSYARFVTESRLYTNLNVRER